jgi:hypothetical protein
MKREGGARCPLVTAMLHKRDVDVIEGVPPANGTSMTTIEIGFRSDYDPDLK